MINTNPYNKQNLEWRPIEGFENQYEVSNYGDFHILPFEFIDKADRKITRKEYYKWSEELAEYGGPNINHQYLGIHLGGMKKTYAHIIAAKAFCKGFSEDKEVNHLDGNHKNNYCGCKEHNYLDSNLEWVTHKENAEHASKNNLINKTSEKRKAACKENRKKVDMSKLKRPVIQLDAKTKEFVKRFESITEAANETGFCHSSIQAVTSHQKYHKIIGGYIWVYEDEYNK